MICKRCRAEFFAPGTWKTLRTGQRFDILQWACEVPDHRECTLCSTILKDTIATLSAYKTTAGNLTGRKQPPKIWQRDVEIWPKLPVKVEKRTGRLSFIVGPCSADFSLQDGSTYSAVSLKARLFIMSPRPHGSETASRTLGSSTESEQSIQQAKDWLHACNNSPEHAECAFMARNQTRRGQPSGEALFVPTRLLDVGTTENPEIRLVGNTQTEGIQGPYTTLSHMWGIPMGDRFQLTNENYEQFCQRIDITDPKLTLTFRHGMEVTRRIGARYLWIDSVCINQGDNADFVRESTKMEEIYRNSYCNIAAVDSENGSQGLFRKRSPEDLPPDIVKFDGRPYNFLRPDLWDQQVLSGPLYSRGWVLQGKPWSSPTTTLQTTTDHDTRTHAHPPNPALRAPANLLAMPEPHSLRVLALKPPPRRLRRRYQTGAQMASSPPPRPPPRSRHSRSERHLAAHRPQLHQLQPDLQRRQADRTIRHSNGDAARPRREISRGSLGRHDSAE